MFANHVSTDFLRTRILWLALIFTATCPIAGRAVAQEEIIPGGGSPLLRIIPDGPLSAVSSLAFSPDGSTLYAGGRDKLVHVWQLSDGRYIYSPESAFRVPVGGGLDGSISAIDVSADGQWLAIGGRGAKRTIAGSRDTGFVLPGASMGPERWSDEGLIYVYNIRSREVIQLRGHQGTILDLTFAPAGSNGEVVLVSAAEVWKNGDYRGELTAWNVTTQAALATIDTMPVQTANGVEQQRFPDAESIFPCRIAAIRTGQQPQQVQVGVAWGDAKFAFRVWNVATNKLSRPAANNALRCIGVIASSRSSFLFLAGDSATGAGQLREIDGTQAGELLDISRSTVKQRFAAGQLPTGAALLPGGQIAAALANIGARRAELAVVSGTGQAVGNVSLWSPMSLPPLLAADSGGQFLAAAGNQGDEIHIFRASDVSASRANPQVLKTAASQFTGVEFVANAQEHGLRLQWQDGMTPSQGVLNLSNGKLQDEAAMVGGWASAAPASPWQVTAQTPVGNDVEFSLTGPNNRQLKLRLGCSSTEMLQVGPFVTLPAGEHCPVPVMVVALHCSGQPQLRVYNLENGEYVRRYVAHTGTIRGLAASSDGRLLASVADDRTVCVWTLSNLDDNLGKHGLLRAGNALLQADSENDVVVVREGLPDLPTDTRILGIDAGELRPLSEAWKLYEHVHQMTPGEEIALSTSAGRKTIVVGQAIDELRPLFSIFLTPSANGQRDWIGWSPLGPYDRGTPAAETSLGWHFNTGEAESPTRFAAVDDYRATFYTPHLLRELFANETIPAKAPAAPPQISLLLHDNQGELILPDEFNQLLTRTSAIDAHISLGGEFPLDQIADVSATLDGPDGVTLLSTTREAGNLWRVDADDIPLSRGSQRLKIQVTSNERPTRMFEERLIIRYQPPAPQIKIDRESLVPQEDQLTLKFEVIPTTGVKAGILVLHEDGAGNVLAQQRWPGIDQTAGMSHPLTLVPGANAIRVTAMNEGATYSFESHERTTDAVSLDWQPAPPADVKVQLTQVTAGEEVYAVENGAISTPLVVGTVQLIALATSDDPLQSLALTAHGESVAVPEFEPGQSKRFEVKVPVSLVAGRQVVALTATTTKGIQSTAQMSLEYLPPLPLLVDDEIMARMVADAPAQPAPVAEGQLLLQAPWHDGTVDISTALQELPADAEQLKPEVLIDGAPALAEVRLEERQVKATVKVPPGQHDVQIRIADANGQQGFGQSHRVSFLRPPLLVEGGLRGDVVDERLATFQASYRSPAELPLTVNALRLTVNGTEIPAGSNTSVTNVDDLWTVLIPDIQLLRDGNNELELNVANDDGACLTSARAQAVARLTIPAPTIIPGEIPTKVTQPELPVEFTVVSEEPPMEVQVRLAERQTQSDAQLLETLPGSGRQKTFKYRAAIELPAGLSHVVLVARNSGGLTRSDELEVSLAMQPVTVLIDKLGSLTPQKQLDGGVTFDADLEDSVAVLEGRVQMSKSAETGPVRFAQVWVNGFNQRTAPLTPVPGKANEFKFTAALTFNYALDNEVQIVLPELAVNQASRLARTFLVNCARPDQSQELFVLIVGPGMHRDADRVQVERDFLDIVFDKLHVREEQGEWKSNAFNLIHPPKLHVGRMATRSHLTAALNKLTEDINSISARQDDARTRAVLMIYYNGREYRVEKDGQEQFLLATTNNWDTLEKNASTALTSTELSSAMSKIQGAHMLLLDVESVAGSSAHQWPSDPGLAVMRVVLNANGEEAPLMSALGDVMPRSRVLGDVAEGLRQVFTTQQLVFDSQIPPALGRTPFGVAMAEE